ncbi:unnamed protein product, partial [marine sediment metagenome]
DEGVREETRKGNYLVNEPQLQEVMEKAKPLFEVVDSVEEAGSRSEITFVVVPTLSLEGGEFSNECVIDVVEKMGHVIKNKKQFHIVVVTSTVVPGSCDKVFKPILEEKSGKVCGLDFGLVYNPEFIALGSVIKDFLNPDMVLIGVEAVCIAGGGEPLCNSAIGRFIQELSRNGLKAGVVTNGYFIDRVVDSLLDLVWVGVSIDAGSKKVFRLTP